jgi:hypothetical protein
MKRIYYDSDRQVIVVGGVEQVFPPRALRVIATGDLMGIWLADNMTRIVQDRYDRLARESGGTFATAQECLDYLNAEFDKAPAGADPNFDGGFF